jgi:DNA-binding NarL/FixJ family response regulator
LIRVRVIASSPALRAGLASMLAADPGITVQERPGSGHDEGARDRDVDVIVMTSTSLAPRLDLPDGEPLGAPVLFLRNDPVDVRTLAGYSTAWGILPLDASAVELQAAVHALAAGLSVTAPSLVLASGESPANGGPLTDRETEVLALLSKGLANKQIAVALGISEHTVKFHVSSIYTKLNATNRTQAVREGLRNGWIVL